MREAQEEILEAAQEGDQEEALLREEAIQLEAAEEPL
jgi:hypothetical protein